MEPGDTPPHDTVVVTIPGSETFLEILRGVVGRVARIAGFSYDGIEDLALVVDEAAVLVLETRPAAVSVSLEHRAGRVVARVSAVEAALPWAPEDLEGDTRWQVITVLCEDHWLEDGPTIGIAQTPR